MRPLKSARIKSLQTLSRQAQRRAFSRRCQFPQSRPVTTLPPRPTKSSSITSSLRHRGTQIAYTVNRSAHNNARDRKSSGSAQTRSLKMQSEDLLDGAGEIYVNPVIGHKDRFEDSPAWLRKDIDPQSREWKELIEKEGASRELLSPLWLQHEEEIALRVAPKKKPVPFTPEVFTAESLITNRIATASSTPASNQAMIESAMAHVTKRDDTSFSFDSELARQVAHGKIVRFKDADEKARILALAEEHAMDTTAKRNRTKLKKLKDGEGMEFETPLPVEFQGIPEKHRKEVVDRVLRGKYGYEGQSNKSIADPALSSIKKALDLNGTYQPSSGDGFLGLFKRLFPQASQRR